LFASNVCGKRRLHLGFPSSHVLPTGPKEDGIIIAGREGACRTLLSNDYTRLSDLCFSRKNKK
ncbi:MAG: hypothetical protein PUD84_05930, partial [Paraprevotella sp.]|nr:hypothetical protein [Paraprevotella sp.]